MDLDVLLLFSRWFHLAAAFVAIGGALFMRVALSPAASQVLDETKHRELREAVRARWARVVHPSIAILLITGTINFLKLGMPPNVKPMPYHAIFGFKFLAAMGVFFLAAVLVGRGAGSAPLRENSAKWLGAIVTLGLIIVLLSGVLSQVRQRHDPTEPVEATAAAHFSPSLS